MGKYVTYAQFREDVMLMRAIGHVSHEVGFYIDIGANDPERESVTKVFYDHNWHGINVDAASAWVELLERDRPRDINIHAAISDKPGEITFYDNPAGGLGTTVASIAEMHLEEHPDRWGFKKITVPALTLTQVCEQHCPNRDIHFLKVDVEGGEGPVLRGLDLRRFRPWVMCIECHLPNHPEVQLYNEWEPYLLENGYKFVYTDTFNRFYVANEHPEIFPAFSLPADDYSVRADVREIEELKQRVRELEAEVGSLRKKRVAP